MEYTMINVSVLNLWESWETKTHPLKLKKINQEKLMDSGYRKGCICQWDVAENLSTVSSSKQCKGWASK